MFLRKIIVAILFVGLSFNGFSQVRQKPKWNLSIDKKEIKVGDEIELVFESPIEKDWYMYANDFDPSLGPIVAFFDFKKQFKLIIQSVSFNIYMQKIFKNTKNFQK